MIRKIFKFFGIVVAVSAICIAVTYYFSSRKLLDKLESNSHMAQTAAGPVQYSLQGESGPVILFIHGTPGGFDHTPFFTTAGLEGFRLLTPSRPGYMATPIETGRTPEEQARVYAALLDTLDIDEVIIWGISGGGPSAIAFAAMFPQRTRAFIGLEVLSQAYAQPLEIPVVMKSDFVSWLLLSLVTRLGEGKAALSMLPDEDVRKIVNSGDGLDRVQNWLWAIWPVSRRQTGWQNDSEQFMSMSLPIQAIKVPTLILNGTDDEAVPYASAVHLAAAIPGARLYTVDKGNHAMALSHAEELAGEINAFLATVYPEIFPHNWPTLETAGTN